ncbi:hypothetical protein ASD64_18400 [Mesorhizobium sp. Root157]|uniref:hypothetical protein n=1 Tax=Mesorhizobium sp. Root157 TaxID=1736477 RepID=UPI0006FA813E|nr:hypothetical protein [Mesorhizobium sp. Root157]KQZ95877.1 hypothetical protein ASD64_18400 [Mesorhizobium sp. Root157]
MIVEGSACYFSAYGSLKSRCDAGAPVFSAFNCLRADLVSCDNSVSPCSLSNIGATARVGDDRTPLAHGFRRCRRSPTLSTASEPARGSFDRLSPVRQPDC